LINSISSSQSAYFLVTHGSTNPQALIFLHELVKLMRSQNILVGGGLLEGHELTLAAQLQEFSTVAQAQGYKAIAILPIFLLAGVHVSADIPEEVAIAQSNFPDLEFRIAGRFGTYPQVLDLLQTKFTEQSIADTKILVAHGSRQVGANLDIINLAQKLGAIAAFGLGLPDLETQILSLISTGADSITVLPYFLSSGGISDAIAKRIMVYSDRLKINLLPIPFTPKEITKILRSVS
jgi:sirohydrochlorin cobaltochelatase